MNEGVPDLFSPGAEFKTGRRVLSVSEVTQDIKALLEGALGSIWVEGEVSNFTASSAGHWYFSLKDRANGMESVLSAAIFSRAAKDVKFKLENGLKVICFGRISVYPPHGKYSLIIETIEPKGIGSLQLALEQLKARLEKEGLFAAERKRPVPYLPANIGVVTSSTGAAIKDILKVLDRRFRDTHIVINPVKVQGDGAKEEIARAIEEFNLLNRDLPESEKIEVLIVGRGGGSVEDLWAFNEEIVARAIYNSRIPVISAVGHERDVTISDLVADLRAATPSVAAELVIPRREDLRQRVEELTRSVVQDFSGLLTDLDGRISEFVHRLKISTEHGWALSSNKLSAAVKKLSILNPAVRLEQYQVKLSDLARQIYVRAGHLLSLKEAGFTGIIENLSNLNPLNILARGYSVTFKLPGGEIVKDAGSLKAGDCIRTKVHLGEITSKVTEVN